MEVGTIVRLPDHDPDSLAEQFVQTEYPVYGVVYTTAGDYCRCLMYVHNMTDDITPVTWSIPSEYLEIVEEP